MDGWAVGRKSPGDPILRAPAVLIRAPAVLIKKICFTNFLADHFKKTKLDYFSVDQFFLLLHPEVSDCPSRSAWSSSRCEDQRQHRLRYLDFAVWYWLVNNATGCRLWHKWQMPSAVQPKQMDGKPFYPKGNLIKMKLQEYFGGLATLLAGELGAQQDDLRVLGWHSRACLAVRNLRYEIEKRLRTVYRSQQNIVQSKVQTPGELLGGEDWFEKHPTSSCGHYQYWQVIPELVMVVADKSLVPDTPSMSCCRLQVAQTPASDFESKLQKLFCDILSSLQLHGTCSNIQMFKCLFF